MDLLTKLAIKHLRKTRQSYIINCKFHGGITMETEVKKGIEWMKEEIGELPCVDTVFNNGGSSYIDSAVPVMAVYDLLDQLDNQEVLSQEIAEENGMSESEWAEVIDRYKWHLEQEGYVVIKKPTIPQFVADWIEASRHATYHLLGAVYDGAYSEDMKEWLFKGDKIIRQDNQDKLTRAWLDGYTVKEEQKYYIDLETAAYVAKWDGNGQVDIYTDGISGSDEYELHLTEKEIKDFDPRFWPFRKPVEEMEE